MTDSLPQKVPFNTLNQVKPDMRGKTGKAGPGGRRIGAGRKKGSKAVKTLLKEEAAKEAALKAKIKGQILRAMPHRLQMSEKALKEAIKEVNKEEIEEVFKQRVALHSNNLLTSLLTVAQGEKFLYKVVEAVDTSGKVKRRHVMVTEPDEIAGYLDNPLEVEGHDYYYIATKSPDVTAINSLLDRFIGKPATKITGPDNPDGSEGAIKIISMNYALPEKTKASEAKVVKEVIKEVVEEDK